MNRKSLLTAMGALIVIGASMTFLWRTQFRPPQINRLLHQGIGESLARETQRVLSNTGGLVVITLKPGNSAALDAQLNSFQQFLERHPGVRIQKILEVAPENRSKYRAGAGLSGSRLMRVMRQHTNSHAVVSFLGVPELDAVEAKSLGTQGPKLIAVARSTKKLGTLLMSGRLQAALVPRFQFPAPVVGEPKTPQEWFDLQFQTVTPGMLPSRED